MGSFNQQLMQGDRRLQERKKIAELTVVHSHLNKFEVIGDRRTQNDIGAQFTDPKQYLTRRVLYLLCTQ